MAATSRPRAHTPSPLARLSRLFKHPSSASPTSADSDKMTANDDDDEWYIPYHGPYEPPRPRAHDGEGRDSWGRLVSGWLGEGDSIQQQQRPRTREGTPDLHNRVLRQPSRVRLRAATTTSLADPPRPSTSTRRNVPSLIHLDQAGGVGEAPLPVRVPREDQHPRPEPSRHSIVNLLSFGQAGRRNSVRHSASVGQLYPDAEVAARSSENPSSSRWVDGESQTLYVKRHPYAFPFSAPVTSTSASPITPVTAPTPTRKRHPPPLLLQKPPPVANASRLNLKTSASTPNLRNASTTPAHPPLALPKGKQRWLSPETWCDALILPRPRFTIRVDAYTGGSSGRIVSPPASVVWASGSGPSGQNRALAERAAAAIAGEGEDRRSGLYKSRSLANLESTYHAADVLRAEPMRVRAGAGVVGGEGGGEGEGVAGPSRLRPPRPKSFALDDLALPSPVPSLSKVLEDGRQLEEQRKAWQSQATRSFQNKRARSFSRARARSLGGANARAAHDAGRTSAMDVLAERTLLGNQTRPPTVHVRLRPSHSQPLRAAAERGAGTSTLTTTASGGRTRSHAHSNSAGTSSSRNHTEESFMWGAGNSSGGPNHARAQSLGRSALRLVRSTASNAATFCGFVSVEKLSGRSPVPFSPDEAANRLESALRRQDTRVIRLQDQVRWGKSRDEHHESVVLITPASPLTTQPAPQPISLGPNGLTGDSPAPSAGSYSGEGIGVAISTPTPSDEQARQRTAGREPLRMPAHPYAQGAAYYYYSAPDRAPEAEVSFSAARNESEQLEDGLVRQRQPVMVHPYSPYAQAQQTSDAPLITRTAPDLDNPVEVQEIALPADSNANLYAELSPGHIREFPADELRYSPFILVHPVQRQHDKTQVDEIPPSMGSSRAHPYGPQSKRTSEWGFADALTQTLRDRGSVDSGIGTCERNDPLRTDDPGISPSSLEASPDALDSERRDAAFLSFSSQSLVVPASSLRTPGSQTRPAMERRETTHSSGNTLASSPIDHILPPSFRRRTSSGVRTAYSSASSPGVVSLESSPPTSPRPLNGPSDDLERFRNLFYRPPSPQDLESRRSESRSRSPSIERPARMSPLLESEASAGIPADISSASTRSVSGLTNLAQQLTDDLEELRELTDMSDPHDDIANSERERMSSPMSSPPKWGRRFGGLRGPRPRDAVPDPNTVLSQSSSAASSPPGVGALSPLRFPLDQHGSLAQPTINVPEDVDTLSRSSSELALQDDADETLRVGIVEALATPPPLSSPHRASSRLSLIHFSHTDGDGSMRLSADQLDARTNSQYSSLGALTSDVARSSYMTAGTTGTSHMSGLSDFPAPPTEVTPEHMSVLDSYFDDNSLAQPHGRSLNASFGTRPAGVLIRESSRGTFGRQDDVGQAL
ncbi:uncharacterized protein FIBRA_04206 [Fibroporia radiculosa]|uniref:Uncharacterized protein n=1 Tax=Fibroporia radiculosa TaxID=599839 RepID=J4H2U4_9APHY|nr:uncharacterized protein FIBRA_04206 [Fibroporia radiculosa]CCM02129.1 predicted protein [Fibroporia radiculosa]